MGTIVELIVAISTYAKSYHRSTIPDGILTTMDATIVCIRCPWPMSSLIEDHGHHP
jgi:hypothetical protein